MSCWFPPTVSLFFYLFMCTFFILFPSASLFLHSSFSNFLVWVIIYLQPLPLYSSITYSSLLFFKQFPALYFGSYDIFNLCLTLLNSNFFLTYRETLVHRARVPYFTPSISSVLLLFLSFLSPSLHPVILYLSLYPLAAVLHSIRPALCIVQLHSNPGRQQDLELTREMRWWNGITSVVRMCVCLVRVCVCVCVCSMNLSSGSH